MFISNAVLMSAVPFIAKDLYKEDCLIWIIP